ncbi:MAG: 7TM diverse intracellular signaling domain-containing protein [Ferruginibacter sp.]
MKLVHKIKFSLLCCLIFCFETGWAQQRNIYYDGKEEIEIVYEQISYIASGDSVTTLEAAQKNYAIGNFLASHNKYLNLGIAKDNYWINFNIISAAAKSTELVLNLENPRLNEVDIYAIRNHQPASLIMLGDNFPFWQRTLYFNQFAVPFTLHASDTISFFFLLKQKGNTLQVPITLHSRNSFYQRIEIDYIVVGIISGIFLITLFFSIFLYLKSSNRLFIFYSLYILSIFFWLISTEGYGFQFLWPGHPEWANRFGPGLSMLNLSTFIAVALSFTKPYDSNNIIRKILWGLAIFSVLWGIQAFMPYISMTDTVLMSFFLKTSFINYGVSLFLSMGYLLYVSLKKNKVVLFYFFAVFIGFLFTLLVLAKLTGLINLPLTSGTFVGLGLVFEIILMTLGIANQFYQYKKEKEEMLLQYIEQQKSITQKILDSQELERKRISRELHDDIGAGLTRIVLMSDSINNHTKENIPVLDNLTETCRKLVNDMGEIVWSLQPENNTLAQVIAYLREELNKMLEYSGIGYNLSFPDAIPEIILSNEERRNMLMIVKEAVHNAVKYSAASNIIVEMQLQPDRIFVTIKDNGKGFDTNEKSNGNGLKNMHQRILETGGQLNIISAPGQGTFIECSFHTGR